MKEDWRQWLGTAILLLYVFLAAWIAGGVVPSALRQLLEPWPAVFVKNPVLLERLMLGLELSIATASAGAKYWAGGFMYRLIARGDWRRAGGTAWIFLLAMAAAPAGLGVFRSGWFFWFAAVGLGGALHGAHWVYENADREEVRGFRELLLGFLGN